IQALDAQRRQAEEHADGGGGEATEEERDDQRHAVNANREVVGRVGAHRHEGAGAERDLAAVADQNVEAERRQREDEEGNQEGLKDVFGGDERNAEDGQEQKDRDEGAVLPDREDLLIGPIRGLELTVFAVKHGRRQTRSMIFSPNSPCGRTRRKTSAST